MKGADVASGWFGDHNVTCHVCLIYHCYYIVSSLEIWALTENKSDIISVNRRADRELCGQSFAVKMVVKMVAIM